MATGVIPIKEFMQGLVDIGYDGPVRTEPFNQALNDLENPLEELIIERVSFVALER